MAGRLNLDVIGVESFQADPSIDLILRTKNKCEVPASVPRLLVCDQVSRVDNKTDILTISDMSRISYESIKRKVKPNLGLEILISNARLLDARELGRWVVQAKSLYSLCLSTRCQFIISSGAQSIFEMISSRTFESILMTLEIPSSIYWKKLSEWLSSKDSARFVKSL